MTRDETIKVLNDYDINFERNTAEEIAEAHEMAIKALQEYQHYKDLAESYEKTINKLTKAIAEQQPSDDCISREAALNIIKRICFSEEYAQFRADYGSNGQRDTIITCIRALPSVTPQPKTELQQKTGHWIEHKHGGIEHIECSECGIWFLKADLPRKSYCPNCGSCNGDMIKNIMRDIANNKRRHKMNELTKIKDRILARIENYIADIELAEEQELTKDEKTILDSVKHIINEEFGQPIPLPRFIINANGEMEQIKTLNENLKDEEVKKFQKFVDDYKGLPAEDKEKICQDAIRTTDAIIRLSQTCGVSYNVAKDIVLEIMEILKEPKTDTAKWEIAGVGVDSMGYRFKEYKCSNCGNIDLSHKKNKFCPECGKRMVE